MANDKSQSVSGSVVGSVETSAPGRSGVFCDVSLDLIDVEKQIRSGIDLESESFLALQASIGEKGVMENVVLVKRDDRYLLLAGERRFLACKQLGLTTIPARVLDQVRDRAEILEIQLAENSLREDIDPIDLGNAMVEYFQVRHDGLSFEQIFNAVIAYDVDPKRLEKAVEVTVTSLTKNSFKSPASLRNTLSLLKLPDEIQEAVKTGRIGVSQGYIFAANLNSPAIERIFNGVLEKPLTNEALKMAFVAAQAGTAKAAKQPQPVQRLRNNIKSVRNLIELQVSKLAPKEMTDLLADMESLTQLIKQEMDRQANEAVQLSAKKEAAAEAKRARKAAEAAAAQPVTETATAESKDSVPAEAIPEPQVPPEPAPETTTPKKTKKKKVLL